MQNNNVEKLQQLLIDQIINNSYNENDFVLYVQRISPNKADDLEQWTYDELKLVIEQFQKEAKNKLHLKSNESNIQYETNIHEAKSLIKKKKIVNLGKIKTQEYEKIIGCKKSEYLIDPKIKLKFTIRKLKQESNKLWGIFGQKNYYEISSNLGKQKRSFQEFCKLRKYLRNVMPDINIPQLPKEEYQEDIEQHLKEFIKIFNTQPRIRMLFPAFLFINANNITEQMKQQNAKSMNEYERLCSLDDLSQRNYTLETQYTSSGQISINVNEQNYQSYQFMKQIPEQHNYLFKQIEKQFNLDVKQSGQFNLPYLETSKLFDNYIKYLQNQNLFINLSQYLESINSIIWQFHKDYQDISIKLNQFIARIIKKTQNIFKSNIEVQTTIECLEKQMNQTFEELFDVVSNQYKIGTMPKIENINISTIKESNLDNYFEKLSQKDPIKIPFQYYQLNQLRDQYGYFSAQFCNQINQQINGNIQTLTKKYTQFLEYNQNNNKLQIQRISQLLEVNDKSKLLKENEINQQY